MRSARPAGVSRSLRRSVTAKSGPQGPPAWLLTCFWGPAQRICAGPSLLTSARHPAPSLLSPGTNSVRWGAPVFAGTVYGPPDRYVLGAIVCPVRSGRSESRPRTPPPQDSQEESGEGLYSRAPILSESLAPGYKSPPLQGFCRVPSRAIRTSLPPCPNDTPGVIKRASSRSLGDLNAVTADDPQML